ncbi:MAG: hypothetical protein JWO90_1456 [Solirubrobacterales bacterium]|jgi:hypothetical protein|nr:hypothetical protein [Solirubrobacterales bacterium]
MPAALRTVTATRYVTPLREGGSMPALVEASDDGVHVLKFRGAGQGVKALVAELVAGELARALGLPVPELVLMEVDPALAPAEPDQEIQDLLKASPGTNLAMDFLPGSLTYNPAARFAPSPELAADVVWFDALVENVDRTPANPNLLVWHDALWLIDHGAALYRHHGGSDPVTEARRPFGLIAQHVLLPLAGDLREADERLHGRVDRAVVQGILDLVPRAWLGPDGDHPYVEALTRRLEGPRAWVEEAQDARA